MSFSMLDIGVAVTREGKGGAWVDKDTKQWLDKNPFDIWHFKDFLGNILKHVV